ncbi:MAG: hypothetical protein R3330_12075, partial [Saprospiraceae bacterium]|nr:hypothetical protein [Saprospiraceae bacterium]
MRLLLLAVISLTCAVGHAQQTDVQRLMRAMMEDTPIEEDLQILCDVIGGRVTGTQANEQAVEWGLERFREAGVKAWKDAFQMPELWLERSTTVMVTGGLNFTAQAVSKFYSPPGSYSTALLDGGTGSAEDFARLGSNARGAFVLVETDLCLDISGLFAEYG